ncbi:tetratricopeptide repeat protein [bacterium]|nr:tetratricopeptide repeat protein [bacterium]
MPTKKVNGGSILHLGSYLLLYLTLIIRGNKSIKIPKILFPASLITFLSLGITVVLSQVMAQTHFQEGIRYSKSAQMEQAVQEFEKVLKIKPSLRDVYPVISDLYYSQNLHAKTIEISKMGLKQVRKSGASELELAARLYFNLANSYFRKRNINQALSNYEKVMRLNPNSKLFNQPGMGDNCPEILFYNGLKYVEEREFNQAIDNFKKALQSDGSNVLVYLKLAETCQMANRLDEAIGAYKKVIDLGKEDVAVFISLGQMYCQKNMLNEAIGYYKKAVNLSLEDPEGYCYLGDLYIIMGQIDRARENFTKAVELASQNKGECYIWALRGVGRTYEQTKEWDKAEQ